VLAAVDIQNSILPWSINIFLAFISVYFWYLIKRESNKRNQTEILLEQRKYISTILDTASILVVKLDLQGKIVEFNRACERTTGYLFDQVKNKYIWDVLMIAEEVKIFQSALDAVITERQPIALETQWITKSGDRRLISWTNTVLCDRAGTVKHVISTGIDISDRKEMEVALRQSEERFKAFMNNSTMVAFVKDKQSRMIYINEPFERAFNVKLENLRGKRDEEWLPEQTVKQVSEHDKIVFSTSKTIETVEIATPNGSSLYWLALKFLIDDTQSRPLSGCIAIDITERKRTEEQIKAALQEKEVLLKEVHHRVKNNLQVIDSLFRHQCRHIQNEQAIQALKESQNRVISMALLHEKLYHSNNLSSIYFHEYVKMVANLFDFYSSYRAVPRLKIDIERIHLDFKLALSCEIIINEFITNSLKYAFFTNTLKKIKLLFLSPTLTSII